MEIAGGNSVFVNEIKPLAPTVSAHFASIGRVGSRPQVEFRFMVPMTLPK
jgi:hypothetical protein